MILNKIFSFLNKQQKKHFFILLALMLVSTLLELMGLNIIFLLVNFFINDNFQSSFNFVERFLSTESLESVLLIKYLAIILVVIFLIKFIFQIFFFRFQSLYIFNLQTYFQNLLLKKYISQDYLFFVYRNSSEFIRNIRDIVHYYTGGVVNSLLNFFAEIILVIGILAFLFYYNFLAAIFALIFFSIIFSFYFMVIKNLSYKLGLNRQNLNFTSLKNLSQIINGIKDIKIYNSENFYLEKFKSTNSNLNSVRSKLVFLSLLPRIIFEFALIIILAVFIFNSGNFGFEQAESLELLSIFAIAAARLLPSMAKIFGSLQTFKANTSSINLLEKEFKLKSITELNNKSNVKFDKEVSFENISFAYNNSDNKILENIDLKINKNKKIGIMGQSGSGKSTLLDILFGFLKPSEGAIKIDGNLSDNGIFNLETGPGYISQEPFLLDDTIRNNIVFGFDEGNNERVKQVLQKVNLYDYIKSLPDKHETVIGERGSRLSGGQAQRIVIARCLYRNPQILIFDEATSSLDVKNENLIMETIKENLNDLTLVIVSHNQNTLKICDIIYKLENKKISKL
jgi:ATP-binding cassette, subfamily B, bacterial PglK